MTPNAITFVLRTSLPIMPVGHSIGGLFHETGYDRDQSRKSEKCIIKTILIFLLEYKPTFFVGENEIIIIKKSANYLEVAHL